MLLFMSNNPFGFGGSEPETVEEAGAMLESDHENQNWAKTEEISSHEIKGRIQTVAGLAQQENPDEIYDKLLKIENLQQGRSAFEECLDRTQELPQDVVNTAYEALMLSKVENSYREARAEGISGEISPEQIMKTVGYEEEEFNSEYVNIEFGQLEGQLPGGMELGFIPHTMYKNVREIAIDQHEELDLRFEVYENQDDIVIEAHDTASEYPEDLELHSGFDREEYNGGGMGLGMTSEFVKEIGGDFYTEESSLANYNKKTVVELEK